MGIYVNPVPYPAVPKRLARIRMSLMATHTKQHLDTTLNALEDVAKKLKLRKLPSFNNSNSVKIYQQ